jgi:hypothetical protein
LGGTPGAAEEAAGSRLDPRLCESAPVTAAEGPSAARAEETEADCSTTACATAGATIPGWAPSTASAGGGGRASPPQPSSLPMDTWSSRRGRLSPASASASSGAGGFRSAAGAASSASSGAAGPSSGSSSRRRFEPAATTAATDAAAAGGSTGSYADGGGWVTAAAAEVGWYAAYASLPTSSVAHPAHCPGFACAGEEVQSSVAGGAAGLRAVSPSSPHLDSSLEPVLQQSEARAGGLRHASQQLGSGGEHPVAPGMAGCGCWGLRAALLVLVAVVVAAGDE